MNKNNNLRLTLKKINNKAYEIKSFMELISGDNISVFEPIEPEDVLNKGYVYDSGIITDDNYIVKMKELSPSYLIVMDNFLLEEVKEVCNTNLTGKKYFITSKPLENVLNKNSSNFVGDFIVKERYSPIKGLIIDNKKESK